MMLSPSGWAEWKQKIDENPILKNYSPLDELRANNPKAWLQKVYHLVLDRQFPLSKEIIQAAQELARQLNLSRYDPADLDEFA